MVDQLQKFSIKDQLRLCIDDMIIKYEIDLEIKQVFYIKDSGYKDNGFVINLEDAGNENNIQLKQDKILSYCETDESYRPDFWIEDFSDYNPIYYTKDFQFIEFIKKINEDDTELIYFIVVGADYVIDVISFDFPKININEQVVIVHDYNLQSFLGDIYQLTMNSNYITWTKCIL